MTEQTAQNPLGMKSIAESMQTPMGVQFRGNIDKIFKWDWIFSTALEKLIVTASLIWSIFSIGRLIYGIFA